MAMLDEIALCDPGEPRRRRPVRPWLVFSVLGVLVAAALAALIVRAIPSDPKPIRDPLHPSNQGYPLSTTLHRISAAQARGLTSMPWKLAAIQDGGRVLGITAAAGGGCVTPVGVYVAVSASRVTVEAVSRTIPGQTACAGFLLLASGRIFLREPLGNRALYHAAIDRDTEIGFGAGL